MQCLTSLQSSLSVSRTQKFKISLKLFNKAYDYSWIRWPLDILLFHSSGIIYNDCL